MKFIIYQDDGYQWRWMLKDADGEITDAAETGFASRSEAVEDARRNGYEGS